MASAM